MSATKFLPIKSIEATLLSAEGETELPWYDPANPLNTPPVLKSTTWRVELNITIQHHSSIDTRNPGVYNGQDVVVGDWIANTTTGTTWKITSIESKTNTYVVAIVEDMARYNTYRDPAGLGDGSPQTGSYVIYELTDAGLPAIDPVPASGISSQFATNNNGRFQYSNAQYNYPLYQTGNTFTVGDVIAVDQVNHRFVLSDEDYKIVVGRVTSVLSTDSLVSSELGWFTISPVEKVVDDLSYLPGDIGDTIYTSLTDPGGITDTPGGTELYIKLKNNTQTITKSTLPGPTVSGNQFNINGHTITTSGAGLGTLASDVNASTLTTSVSALVKPTPVVIETNFSSLSSFYGFIPVLNQFPTAASITLNGIPITFNIDTVGTITYGAGFIHPVDMAESINLQSMVTGITATGTTSKLTLRNEAGGPITIVNVTADGNGVNFAGTNSGSGLPLNTNASADIFVEFTTTDARAIEFSDVTGTTTLDFGLISAENGVKAAGLYIEQGLRNANVTVVSTLAARNGLTPLIGDMVYVIDSTYSGNNVGQWSLWIYDGSAWVQTSNEASASTDARSYQIDFDYQSLATIDIGKLSDGRKVIQVIVEVMSAFDSNPTISVGHTLNTSSLMAEELSDLKVQGTYTVDSDFVFTAGTDIQLVAEFDASASTYGQGRIIITYV